jgi:excisionase family DNA binding protein
MTRRAYTVASLAQEWECSEGVIRKAIADGRLGCFRLGTLIRIPAEEVRRFECQNTPSRDSAAPTQSSGETRPESATACGYTRPTGLERKLRRGEAGTRGAVHPGPWAGS